LNSCRRAALLQRTHHGRDDRVRYATVVKCCDVRGVKGLDFLDYQTHTQPALNQLKHVSIRENACCGTESYGVRGSIQNPILVSVLTVQARLGKCAL
jgi:hypothetical protein